MGILIPSNILCLFYNLTWKDTMIILAQTLLDQALEAQAYERE